MRCTCAFRHHTLDAPSNALQLLAYVNFQAMRCTCAFRRHLLEVPSNALQLLAYVNFQAMRCTCAFCHNILEVASNVLHLGIVPPYYVVAVEVGLGGTTSAI
jgi:hypothetical protein